MKMLRENSGQLFAMWHRPYLMLFEKILHEHALAIVSEIKDTNVKAKWRTAASKLRLPLLVSPRTCQSTDP